MVHHPPNESYSSAAGWTHIFLFVLFVILLLLRSKLIMASTCGRKAVVFVFVPTPKYFRERLLGFCRGSRKNFALRSHVSVRLFSLPIRRFRISNTHNKRQWGDRRKKGRRWRSSDSDCPPDGSILVSKLGHN